MHNSVDAWSKMPYKRPLWDTGSGRWRSPPVVYVKFGYVEQMSKEIATRYDQNGVLRARGAVAPGTPNRKGSKAFNSLIWKHHIAPPTPFAICRMTYNLRRQILKHGSGYNVIFPHKSLLTKKKKYVTNIHFLF